VKTSAAYVGRSPDTIETYDPGALEALRTQPRYQIVTNGAGEVSAAPLCCPLQSTVSLDLHASIGYLAQKVARFQSPPRAFMSSTLAVRRRETISIAVMCATNAAFSVATTSRYVTMPLWYRKFA
jgi:hypothetical protein